MNIIRHPKTFSPRSSKNAGTLACPVFLLYKKRIGMTQPFFSQQKSPLTLEEVIDEVTLFVEGAPERMYHIIVGSDSRSAHEVELVTAITVWRVGNGAIHFWTKTEPRAFAQLRDRIYAEVIRSITLAQEVRSRLRDRLHEKISWDDQIHIDVGEKGPTREFIDTAVGMVRGYGFEAFIKPQSFGASVVADRHT